MIVMKRNNLLVEMQEVEHSTESGIILDQSGDKYISFGKLIQDAIIQYNDREEPEMLHAGLTIMFSKDKFIPLENTVGIVEFHNVIGWKTED